MFIKKIILSAKKRYLTLSKKCIFGKNTEINRDSEFEGCNLLADYAKLTSSYIGYASYLGEKTYLQKCQIGKYTSIGPCVCNIVGKHPTKFVSTHPSFFSVCRQVGFTYVDKQKYNEFAEEKYDGHSTKIGNDVWIGARVTILDGVCIGDGAIIGAGAVVTSDIPPYAIAVGIPAKVIKYRFTEEQIDHLLELQWWNKDEAWIREHAEFYEDIDTFLDMCK